MAVAQARGAVCVGVTGQLIEVQTHLSQGLPGMTIVGLPDTAISESRDRVRSAVVNSGFDWPLGRITVGLSPAFEHKRGSGLDLAVAIAVLAGNGVVRGAGIADTVFLGELGLDGSIREVPGAVAMGLAVARNAPGSRLMACPNTAVRMTRIPGLEVVAVPDLAAAVGVLRGERSPAPLPPAPAPPPPPAPPDLSDVVGQPLACRALEVAAAGRHHLLMHGPPGCGKTMLAQRLTGLLPPLTDDQLLELAAIHDAVDADALLSRVPPFRSPHHSASHVAMVGGTIGRQVRPGQISLAHHGVLFLDEAPEFARATLEALRQPLEQGAVDVARAVSAERLPARFQLVLAANPCPCGRPKECTCTPAQRQRYRTRLSRPLLDRIDITLRLGSPRGHARGPASSAVRARVVAARQRSQARLTPLGVDVNARVPSRILHDTLALDAAVRDRLHRAGEQQGWSRRGLDRVLRLSWTIADLAELERPGVDELDEAIVLRGAGMDD